MRPPKIERNKEIVKLKDVKGLSFSEIGQFFNISKQTAHEIYHNEKSVAQEVRQD